MQPPTNKQTGKVGLQSLVIVLVFLVGLAAIFSNHQNIRDFWQLRGYAAPAEVATIATQDTLTDYGRKILYVNQPQINHKADFGQYCPDASREHTIVLGCYHSDQAGIFLLNVTDPRLNGVKQVTAAHEMLHAAYDRLSNRERQAIDAQLMAYYKNSLKDERLLKTIEAYKKSEPSDVVNEMHSIFGTEIASLPAALEEYYSKYFVKRAQVVAFSAQYQAEFTSRKDKVAAADARLNTLKDQIEGIKKDLEAKQKEITSRQELLVAQRNSGDVDGYNSGVPGYNNMIEDFNNQANSLKGIVAQYNELVASRNAIALEQDQLQKSLSADVAPINN